MQSARIVLYCHLCPVRGPELFHAEGRTDR